MATFTLGSIVTQIVGSIGGTTFKRGRNSLIISRKSYGGSRSKLLQNKRLGNLGLIFQAWASLSLALRTSWSEQASLIQFPDKNGVLKFLTGRQLYTKLNSQMITSDLSIQDPAGLVTVVGNPTLAVANLVVSTQAGIVQIVGGTNNARFNLYAQKLPFAGASVDIRKAKFIFNNVQYSPGNFALGTAFTNIFGAFVVSDNYIFFVEEISNFGFKSTPATRVANITP